MDSWGLPSWENLPENSLPENLPANAREARYAILIPASGRSPEVGNGNPLCYSCLENSMNKGAGGLQSMGVQRVGQD